MLKVSIMKVLPELEGVAPILLPDNDNIRALVSNRDHMCLICW